MQTYAQQAGKVLDMERITLEYNSKWLSPLTMADLLRLLSQVTRDSQWVLGYVE